MDENCDVEVVVQSVTAQACNLICDKITDWNAVKIIRSELSIVFVS